MNSFGSARVTSGAEKCAW